MLKYLEDGGPFGAEGYPAVDEGTRRKGVGHARGTRLPRLARSHGGRVGSRVTVYLGFDELSVESETRERAPEGEGPLDEGISATPESIRRQLEEGSGKVQPPPPPDADAPTGENPTIRPPTPGRGRRTVGRSGSVQRRLPEG